MPSAKLTARQARFAELYVLYGNATQAAIEAGYSKKTAYSQGQRLLKNVEIQKAIANKQAFIADEAENLAIDRQKEAMEIYSRALAKGALDTALRANDQLIKLGGFYAPGKIDINSHENWLKKLK